MCASLPGTFSVKIEALQATKMQRYIVCIGINCSIYIVDIITMKIVKIYTTSDQQYYNHLYMYNVHSLWIVDNRCSFFFWRLADKDDIKIIKRYNKERMTESEVPKQMNPLASITLRGDLGKLTWMEKIGDKDILVVFEKQLYVIRDTDPQPGQELHEHPVKISGLEGTLVSASSVDRLQLVVLISSACKLYYMNLADLLNPAVNEARPQQVVSLVGFRNTEGGSNFTPDTRVIYSFGERAALAMREIKQKFFVWELAGLEDKKEGTQIIKATTERPWRTLSSSDPSQVRLNAFLDSCGFFMSSQNMRVFRDDETVTANITHTSTELSSPFYIVGTNLGNVFMFRIFMSDTRNIAPILLVEGLKSPVTQLCVKKDRLLASAVDGSLSITDVSPEKLQKACEKYYADRKDRKLESGEKFLMVYRDSSCQNALLPGGIAGFFEIRSMTREDDSVDQASGFQIVGRGRPNPALEDQLGVVGCDNSVLIISMSTQNVVHKYKGHDAKVIGLYLNESVNSLIVLTKSLTAYIYSAAGRTLERKVSGAQVWKMFDLQERVAKLLTKDSFTAKYGDIFKLYTPRDNVLRKGCHKTLDFCNLLELVQLDWKNPGTPRQALYKTLCSELGTKRKIAEPWRNIDILTRVFNEATNIRTKLSGKCESSAETGFASAQIKIGRGNTRRIAEIRKRFGSYRGGLKRSTLSSVLILSLEDLLVHLQKNYKVLNKGPIFDMFERGGVSPEMKGQQTKEEEKAISVPVGRSPSPTKSSSQQTPQKKEKKVDELLTNSPVGKPGRLRADALWPLPLMSLVHSFGINKKIDKDLGDEFCICPPLLQLWVGVPGVESALSFGVPEVFDPDWPDSQGLFNWKVSPYVNSIQSMMLFSSLVTIFHFNDQFIASVINRLLGATAQFLFDNKAMPYISFVKLSNFFSSRDPDVWCTSRDIILRPFLKKARPETFMNMASQLSNLINSSYDKLKKDPEYKRALGLLKERATLVKFDFLDLINNYFGEVELRALSVLSYTFSEHFDLAATPKTVKRCIKLICFLIG